MLHQTERYVVDEKGERVAVLLGIEEYQQLLDELTAYRSKAAETDQSEMTPRVGRAAAESDQEAAYGITFHPRSPDASPERLRELMGIIKLTGPVPSWRLFDDEDAEEDDRRAGHRAGD